MGMIGPGAEGFPERLLKVELMQAGLGQPRQKARPLAGRNQPHELLIELLGKDNIDLMRGHREYPLGSKPRISL